MKNYSKGIAHKAIGNICNSKLVHAQ